MLIRNKQLNTNIPIKVTNQNKRVQKHNNMYVYCVFYLGMMSKNN